MEQGKGKAGSEDPAQTGMDTDSISLDEAVCNPYDPEFPDEDYPDEDEIGPRDSERENLEEPEEEDDLSFPQNDTGNARRLVAINGKNMRFAAGWWYLWNGRVWQRVEDSAALAKTADVPFELEEEAEDFQAVTKEEEKIQRAMRAFAVKSGDLSRRCNMLELAKSEPGITVEHDCFDADPWKLACPDHTIDLRTGLGYQHSRENMITVCTPTVPGGKAPRFRRFIEEIFDGDRELIGFMQRSLGYALTGDRSEQCLWILNGPGANGKSKLMDSVAHALGKDLAKHADISTFLHNPSRGIPEDRARLAGSRMVITGEPANSSLGLDEGFLKVATGDSTTTARFLHRDTFEFTPQFKLFISTNHLPRIVGKDNGIWRRIRLVEFKRTFERDAEPDLEAKLFAEAPGILAWMLEGLRDYVARGYKLDAPSSVLKDTQFYRDNSDPVRLFVDEFRDPPGREAVSDIYRAYRSWCQENGYFPLSKGNLGTALESLGITQCRGNGGIYMRRGLTL